MEAVKHKYNDLNVCPECGGVVIEILERGESVCEECGLVIFERSLDISHVGRRAFTAQERNSREQTGSPISSLMPYMGLTTVIDRKQIKNPDLKRASKWNSRVSWQKRNLLIASTELKRISSNLNIPDHVKKIAFSLYKRAFKEKLLRGRSINAMVGASLYYACRKAKIPITLSEIIEQSLASTKDVRKCFFTLVKELNLKLSSRDPMSLVPRYVAELGLNSEIQSLTNKILKKFLSGFSSSGKDPKGLVAGAIYLACKVNKEMVTQSRIAKTVGITDVTLRSRYKQLVKCLKITV